MDQPQMPHGDRATEPIGEVSPLVVETTVQVSQKLPFRLAPIVAGLVAVLVLAAGSVAAITQFSSSAADGAESPEAAVQEFFVALGDEDLLGAAELIEPSERRTLVNPGIEIVGELQRLGVLADDLDLSSVDGIDLQFDNMTYSPESLGGGVVRVAVDGQATLIGNVAELPLGSLVTDRLDEELAELAEEGPETNVEEMAGLGVVAVERDGGWYVSMWYSVAEAARRSSGLAGLPAFGNGPTPSGGDSPEDAVWAMANGVSALSLEEMLAAIDPEEAAALYDYSTLFLDDAQAELDKALAENNVEITFDRIDMRSETNGDDGSVWLDGVAVTAVVEETGRVSIDSEAACLVFVESYEDGTNECMFTKAQLDDAQAELGTSFTDSDAAAVRVHRVDGRWYLSPTASITEPILGLLRQLGREQLESWIDDPFSLFEEAGLGDLGGLGGFDLGGFAGNDPVAEAADSELVDVFVVQEFAPAGTPAFDVKAEIEQRSSYELFEPVPMGETDVLSGTTTNVDLYPGDVLQSWMFTQ
ncbi:MAG: hypothetical protein V3V01_14565 [Acidimicrobiales bacterium]